jgi:hypothetical protein
MKKNIVVFGLIIGGVLLGGCSLAVPTEYDESQVLENTTLSGVLVFESGVAVLQQGGEITELDSYNVDLQNYNGKTVTVTGQYSGETLFVDEIK